MNPLTPDERTDEQTSFVRVGQPGDGVRVAPVPDVADKLEAEPEPPEGNPVASRELALARARDVRERDEAREDLEQIRVHLEDARSALDGPMEGATPPDCSISDLAEAVARSASLTRRGRDEAREAIERAEAEAERWKSAAADASIERDTTREALRELLNAHEASAITYAPAGSAVVADACILAREVLEGVERTHTLVPVAALESIAERFQAAALDAPLGTASKRFVEMAKRVQAAARGEHVEWPS